jgi:hypothetical protein
VPLELGRGRWRKNSHAFTPGRDEGSQQAVRERCGSIGGGRGHVATIS